MRTTAGLLLLLLSTTIAAQLAPAPSKVFEDLLAKGGVPPSDLMFLYLADRISKDSVEHGNDAVAPAAVNAEFVAAANADRTDMQVGASSNSPGATSLIDKPGAADLLALALERGAINKQTNGSAVTLTTTPYMLAGFIGVRDNPQNWHDYAALRHIAISASFADSSAVTEGDLNSVQSGEVKWTILGNRSPRDAALLQSFLNVASQPVVNADSVRNVACASLSETFFPQITQFSAGLAGKNATELRSLLDSIFAQVTLTPDQRAHIGACGSAVIDAEMKANGAAAKLNAMTQAYLALNEKKHLSLSFSSHRDTTVDDYATVKIIYAYDTAPKITVHLNAEGDFNQHHEHKNLHQVRSFAAELGSTLGRFNGNRFDATTSAKIWRNNDSANRNVLVAQLKGNVYLTDTFTLPVSVSYANKPTDNIKKGFQVNVGISSLFDALLAKPMGRTP
jgi:hypothetical protein